MTMNKKDILTIFVIALLGTTAVLWVTADNSNAVQQSDDDQPTAVAVEITQPTVKTVADHLPYLGTVAGTKDGNLSFRIGGMLDQIHVKEGDKVHENELLATISVPELDAQIRRAQSEFNKAKSSKTFWEREVSIDSALYKDGAISQTVFNKTNFNYEQSLNSFYAAKAALEEVRERKKQTQLHAPADGAIGSIMIREGSNIAPNQPVFFLHQGEPTIYADVLEQDIRKGIKVGSSVTAELTNHTVRGKVERMDSQAKPPFRSIHVFTSFPDSAFYNRPSGSGVTLRFEINNQENALLVPVSSIDLRSEHPRLFKINNQMQAKAISIELGVQRGEFRQVEGNISPKDKIISSGVNNVEPGDRVEITREITLNK